MKNHDAQPPPRAPREVVLRGEVGWISGPSADVPGQSEPVTADDSALAQLQADWPRWHIWVVPGVAGGPPTWCARRHADRDAVPARVLNAGSAEHLAEYIAAAVSE